MTNAWKLRVIASLIWFWFWKIMNLGIFIHLVCFNLMQSIFYLMPTFSPIGEGNGSPLQWPSFQDFAWKIPWIEEPGRLQSMGLLRVGHDWVTSLSIFTFHFHALEKEMATHSSVLAWRIPGKGEPGGLPSMGLPRARHDWSDLAAAAAVLLLSTQSG